MYKVLPYIGKNRLLRVGAWLNHSTLEKGMQHPLLIKEQSIVSKLLSGVISK